MLIQHVGISTHVVLKIKVKKHESTNNLYMQEKQEIKELKQKQTRDSTTQMNKSKKYTHVQIRYNGTKKTHGKEKNENTNNHA